MAATIYVPDGANVRVHTGALVVGGDGLGAADDVLIVIGMLVITSPVTGPVPQRIHVVGSVLAPRGSESALGPALAGGTGGVTYYRYADGQDIKVLSGQVRLSGAMLANPAGQPDDILIAAGQVVMTGEVTTRGVPAGDHRRAAGRAGGQPGRARAAHPGARPGRPGTGAMTRGSSYERHQPRPGLLPPARSPGQPGRARRT